ncbi:low temperature requirement protein A [Paramicrobacterium agarici]|uniref:Low temperature requirement protein LtrA n=1 Tax=Paramicrobacterium agarici TaxID=630514 RepID=A0A2A9DVX3_9MICO|nr:low temperature requirement protein A [Microbacterium agarici]PFG30142.1 low temperature requirement protein LtrA [Microbacterium agarici]
MTHTPPSQRVGRRSFDVAPIELFFDLVYVFAIIQLSHLLVAHLSWLGALEMVVVFAAVWWGWNYTAWAMNWLDPSRTTVQVSTGVLMLMALGMAIAIPDAFGNAACLFVGCYLLMGVMRPLLVIASFRGTQIAHNYRMLLAWTLFAGVFWVVGAALDPSARLALWIIAVAIDYAAPLLQFRVPGVGSAPMHLWDTEPEHLAERNRLVFIIALGESILMMGGTIVDAEAVSPGLVTSLLLGFAALFVLWWNYFALAGHNVQGGDGSTAALRSAYAYAHAFMVLGAILVAVSTELRLSHEHLTPATVVVTIAGPFVYLMGNVLFLRSRFGRLAASRFVAMALLLLIGAGSLFWLDHVPTIMLSIAVLAVITALAVTTVVQSSRQR